MYIYIYVNSYTHVYIYIHLHIHNIYIHNYCYIQNLLCLYMFFCVGKVAWPQLSQPSDSATHSVNFTISQPRSEWPRPCLTSLDWTAMPLVPVFWPAGYRAAFGMFVLRGWNDLRRYIGWVWLNMDTKCWFKWENHRWKITILHWKTHYFYGHCQ